MNCATLKEGTYCSFMTASGCSFNGGRCYVIVENCQGCDRVSKQATGEYCSSFPNPAIKWEFGKCNFATHIKVEKLEAKKLNPLKASKRAAGK
jgi:hypothetical protein